MGKLMKLLGNAGTAFKSFWGSKNSQQKQFLVTASLFATIIFNLLFLKIGLLTFALPLALIGVSVASLIRMRSDKKRMRELAGNVKVEDAKTKKSKKNKEKKLSKKEAEHADLLEKSRAVLSKIEEENKTTLDSDAKDVMSVLFNGEDKEKPVDVELTQQEKESASRNFNDIFRN